MTMKWAEGLFAKSGRLSGGGDPNAAGKGNRDEIYGKRFAGGGPVFRPDGGRERVFSPLWWEAGRYVEITVKTADEDLVLDSLKFEETRYPLAQDGATACDDADWDGIARVSLRSLQMCSHETFFDCPYYEQLMYVGDSRLEALTTYVVAHDARLPRKALAMFDASRVNSRGLTLANYPNAWAQVIPPFSVLWTLMVHDYALWRGDRAFVQSLMPGVRSVLETFAASRNADGLIPAPDGWNFMDWVPEWKDPTQSRNWGMPPGADLGVNGLLQWLVVLALAKLADVETWLGEPELAARAARLAAEISSATQRVFFDKATGMFSEDAEHRHFSEHSQCLAILGGTLGEDAETALANRLMHYDGNIARTTIYFRHYLFEMLAKTGHADDIPEHLALWRGLVPNGLKTTIEEPEPSRSDCHAWGAHPLYHFYASTLGIRPAKMGFATVEVKPRLGAMEFASGKLPHPLGFIEVDLKKSADGRGHEGTVTLPAGLEGVFDGGGAGMQPLHAGTQRVRTMPA